MPQGRQTETGWPICANLIGLEQLPIKPGSATVPVPGYDVRILDVYEEEADAFAEHFKKARAKAVSPAVKQLDELLAQVKTRAAAGEKKLTIQQGTQSQTMSVTELIKKLEDMKKKL